MARRARSSAYASAFGKALSEQLSSKGLRQIDVSTATNSDPSYVNRLMVGKAKVSPEWADIIAEAIKATPEERRKLHRAAAISWGYDLDLTKRN